MITSSVVLMGKRIHRKGKGKAYPKSPSEKIGMIKK
jgi:hypothetical protein